MYRLNLRYTCVRTYTCWPAGRYSLYVQYANSSRHESTASSGLLRSDASGAVSDSAYLFRSCARAGARAPQHCSMPVPHPSRAVHRCHNNDGLGGQIYSFDIKGGPRLDKNAIERVIEGLGLRFIPNANWFESSTISGWEDQLDEEEVVETCRIPPPLHTCGKGNRMGEKLLHIAHAACELVLWGKLTCMRLHLPDNAFAAFGCTTGDSIFYW